MKQCLNCQKEFAHKREAARYCSDRCRVQYNRKHPKDHITKTQMQVLYNEMLALAGKLNSAEPEIKRVSPSSPELLAALYNQDHPEQRTTIRRYDYNGLKELISAATSSHELEESWRIVKAANLAGWQLRELTKIRETQQTKIDF